MQRVSNFPDRLQTESSVRPMFAPSRKRLRQLARDESTPTALQNVLTFAIIIVVCVLSLRLIGLSSHDKFNTASEAITPDSQADR